MEKTKTTANKSYRTSRDKNIENEILNFKEKLPDTDYRMSPCRRVARNVVTNLQNPIIAIMKKFQKAHLWLIIPFLIAFLGFYFSYG